MKVSGTLILLHPNTDAFFLRNETPFQFMFLLQLHYPAISWTVILLTVGSSQWVVPRLISWLFLIFSKSKNVPLQQQPSLCIYRLTASVIQGKLTMRLQAVFYHGTMYSSKSPLQIAPVPAKCQNNIVF